MKNVSLAEEHLHDLYPAFPIMPHSLIIEGMAQTAGILVGEARNFSEKVILAKIGRATFHRLVRPGDTLYLFRRNRAAQRNRRLHRGRRPRRRPRRSSPLVAEIELMFSHIDKNLAGTALSRNTTSFSPSNSRDLLEDLSLRSLKFRYRSRYAARGCHRHRHHFPPGHRRAKQHWDALLAGQSRRPPHLPSFDPARIPLPDRRRSAALQNRRLRPQAPIARPPR